MATVDAKGRIVLPKDVREDLGLRPGTEVAVREADGTIVIEPERDPEDILQTMDELLENIKRTPVSPEEMDPISRKHHDLIKRRAQNDG